MGLCMPKAKSNANQTSFSSNSNQKRLDILNQNRTTKLSVSIQDLNSENIEQPGTIVTLTIPIN